MRTSLDRGKSDVLAQSYDCGDVVEKGGGAQARRPVMTELRACEEERTRHMKEAHSSFLGFACASLWIMLSSALSTRRLNETNALFML